MRLESLAPLNPDAEMPDVYRLWRLCTQYNELWWDGGIADQPHVLMLEFDACERGQAASREYIDSIARILNR